MQENEKRLGEEKISKLLISFAFPAFIGMMVISTYSIIDRIFVGRVVGPMAISGIAVTFPISLLMMAFGMLIGIGAGARISIYLGQKKREEAQLVLGNAFSLLLIIATIISLCGLIFLNPILQLFGASPEVFPYAQQFISIILGGAFFQFIAFGLNGAISAEGNPKVAMQTMLLSAFLNIVLLVVFIYILHWGIRGSALATVISQFISSLWVLAHFRGKKSNLKLTLANMKLNKKIVFQILIIGIAPFTLQLGASIVVVVLNIVLAKYGGDIAIAAMGVIYSVTFFMIVPIIALTQGAQPIIGYNYGAKNFSRVKQTLKLAIIIASLISIGTFMLVEIFPHYIIHFFSKDQELVRLGSSGLRYYLLMLPVIGFQIVAANFFLAIGNGPKSMVLNLLRQVVILIPALLILPHFFGLQGIWIAGPLSDGLAATVTGIFLYYELKHLDEKHEKTLSNLAEKTNTKSAYTLPETTVV